MRRLTLVIVVAIACSPELSESPLPERASPVDTSALPMNFRSSGGPVLLYLTGWANPESVRRLEAVGLQPLPEYPQVEILRSMGMNVVGGTIPPDRLDSIMAVPYVLAIEPAP